MTADPTLVVVATPLGNLQDLSPRGLETLRSVPLILAEDTRVTKCLTQFSGSRARLLSCHRHNEYESANEALNQVEAARAAALVSDAGTPGLRDPGRWIVDGAWARGFRIVPIPGPSAAPAALSCSGFDGDRWTFLGYLPQKAAARREVYDFLEALDMAAVLFAAPHDAKVLFPELAEALADRRVLVARELTKLHETLWRGPARDLPSLVKEASRGELTLVVEGAALPPRTTGPDHRLLHLSTADHLREVLRTSSLSRKEAARVVARSRRIPQREVYAIAVTLGDIDAAPDPSAL